MNDYAEFYAVCREHIGAQRAYHDAARLAMKDGMYTTAEELLDKARAEQDAMLADMRQMNESRAS